jgi:transposase
MGVLKKERFSILDCHGNSPDLNPIENFWSHMKRKLKEDHTITSVPKLMQAIKKMWLRLQMVIDQKGEMTKYRQQQNC